MSLFTVLVYFADGTGGPEQCEAETPREALVNWVMHTRALTVYDRTRVMVLIGNDHERLIELPGCHGVWQWLPPLKQGLGAIYGGHIIQTDPHAPYEASGALAMRRVNVDHYPELKVKQQELLDALKLAEQSGDPASLELALESLARYFSWQERFAEAAAYQKRLAALLEKKTGPDAHELGTFLHNMAANCLIPAGLIEDARAALLRAKQIYAVNFWPWDHATRHVEQLLQALPTHETDSATSRDSQTLPGAL